MIFLSIIKQEWKRFSKAKRPSISIFPLRFLAFNTGKMSGCIFVGQIVNTKSLHEFILHSNGFVAVDDTGKVLTLQSFFLQSYEYLPFHTFRLLVKATILKRGGGPCQQTSLTLLKLWHWAATNFWCLVSSIAIFTLHKWLKSAWDWTCLCCSGWTLTLFLLKPIIPILSLPSKSIARWS